MASSTSMPFAIFFLLFMAIIHGSSGAIHEWTALDELCENALGSYNITPEQCRSALCYDPSLPCNAAHNMTALATFATKLTMANATAARESIKATLSSFIAMHNSTLEDEETRAAMLSCLDLYTGIMPALQWVANSVGVEQYNAAQEVIGAIHFIPYACQGMVESAGLFPKVVVLSKENDGFATMTYVMSAIIALQFRDESTHQS